METSLLRFAAVAVSIAAILSTCDGSLSGTDAATVRAHDEAQELQGTWLRESEAGGLQARHVLALRPDGTFQESVELTDSAGHVTHYSHQGTWAYDGTNLKRKYSSFAGKPTSRLTTPFATFEIAFESPNEFTGIDHIHGNRIRYRRVAQ